MATTYVLGVPTLEEYDLKLLRIPVASLANFTVIDSKSEPDFWSATYSYGAGTVSTNVVMYATRRYDQKRGLTFNTVRVASQVVTTVSETGAVTYSPVEATIGWSHSGHWNLDASNPVILLSILMSLMAQELTGANGTPTSKVALQFDHSVVTRFTG